MTWVTILKKTKTSNLFFWGILGFLITMANIMAQTPEKAMHSGSRVFSAEQLNATISRLSEAFGPEARPRIEIGVQQVAHFWQPEDGSFDEFAAFCQEHFVKDADALRSLANRFEYNFEQIYGLFTEMGRELSAPVQLDLGPLLPVDLLFAEYNPAAHVTEDLFRTKIAFVVLLNFRQFTLAERLTQGASWSRAHWAQARLANGFSARVPAQVNQKISQAFAEADHYISNYNIYMHQLLSADNKRLFPEGLKLISHWGLRDELKAHYASTDGIQQQKLIEKLMQAIITQTIPAAVIDNSNVTWNPFSGAVTGAAAAPEPNTRYQHLLSVFNAVKLADPYHPMNPTFIDRRFNEGREITESGFRTLLENFIGSPIAKDVAKIIQKRLGRKLEPFDIWYNGFRPRSSHTEAELDRIVAAKYPTIADFQKDLPNILSKLGFSQEMAEFLAGKITVDPSRGVGHALGAARRQDNAHLRTRFGAGGMNYKGYNIAIHELGHNVEQVLSLNKIDHTLLQGVPNTAFTEAFAFAFQVRDLRLLGIEDKNAEAANLTALNTFWATYEIAGVGLVDMAIWNWLYQHPEATPEQLKQAVIQIAREIWNQYYFPVLGHKDCILLAIYSHIIDAGLYLPDYSLGHIIQFQMEDYLKDKNLGQEMERMCRLGTIAPDLWMQAAVGSPISTEPLITAAKLAVKQIKN